MKTRQILLIIIIVLILAGVGIFITQKKAKKEKIIIQVPPSNMEIKSPAFENNQFIPKKYTCDGEDINPPLRFEEVPKEAKSLVLIVDDPDAPIGIWSHWVVFNIKPSVNFVNENSVPEGGIEGINDFGKHSYGGPCPPSGTHHYYFRLYALDRVLDLGPDAKREDVLEAIENHVLASSELVGLYKRK